MQPAPHALVVDDDAGVRLLLTRVLARRGFLVDSARDGEEAIQQLESSAYDVVLLDLMMPRVDGAGVMKFLAASRPEQLPAVIVMTAFGAAAQRLSPQPACLLEKPFDMSVLVAAVDACAR